MLLLAACGRVNFDGTGIADDATRSIDVADLVDGLQLTCAAATAPVSCSASQTRVMSLVGGVNTMCAVRDTGLACWGRDQENQLGICSGGGNVLEPIDTFTVP